MSIETALDRLGRTLPPATPTQFDYAPLSLHGGVARLAGQIPKTGPDRIRAAGRVGAEVSLDEAREDAALCVLHGLAWLRASLGDLDRVERPLRLTVFVRCGPGFDAISSVADGASGLLRELFGAAQGITPRSVIGVTILPRSAPVMVEATYALAP